MSFRRAADVDSVWPGEMKGVIVGGVPVLLVNVAGALFAYEDRCAHRGVALSRGRLQGGTLTCWAHAWQYDVCRGGAGVNPRNVTLRQFPAKMEAGGIWVDVGEHPAPPGRRQEGPSDGLGDTREDSVEEKDGDG